MYRLYLAWINVDFGQDQSTQRGTKMINMKGKIPLKKVYFLNLVNELINGPWIFLTDFFFFL